MDHKKIHDAVHRILVEQYPMYRENPAFEEWLVGRTGGEQTAVLGYLRLLEDYGHLNGEGAIDGDYHRVPELSHVQEEVRRRLDALEPRTQAALRAGSIQGDTFLGELARHAGGLAADGELDRVLAPALTAGLIAEDGEDTTLGEPTRRYQFVPRHTGEIVYRSIPGNERSRMHETIVQYLTERRAAFGDQGSREMIGHMIEEHNRRASRPDPDTMA